MFKILRKTNFHVIFLFYRNTSTIGTDYVDTLLNYQTFPSGDSLVASEEWIFVEEGKATGTPR